MVLQPRHSSQYASTRSQEIFDGVDPRNLNSLVDEIDDPVVLGGRLETALRLSGGTHASQRRGEIASLARCAGHSSMLTTIVPLVAVIGMAHHLGSVQYHTPSFRRLRLKEGTGPFPPRQESDRRRENRLAHRRFRALSELVPVHAHRSINGVRTAMGQARSKADSILGRRAVVINSQGPRFFVQHSTEIQRPDTVEDSPTVCAQGTTPPGGSSRSCPSAVTTGINRRRHSGWREQLVRCSRRYSAAIVAPCTCRRVSSTAQQVLICPLTQIEVANICSVGSGCPNARRILFRRSAFIRGHVLQGYSHAAFWTVSVEGFPRPRLRRVEL